MTIHSVAPAQPELDYSRAWAKIRAVQSGAALTPPCTHIEATREHLDTCCAGGVDCDLCGKPINGLTGLQLEPGEIAVCTDCGFDRMDALGIEAC